MAVELCRCCQDAGELPVGIAASECATCGSPVCQECLLNDGLCCQCRQQAENEAH